MLQNIRDRATGWIAWIIVILLIIPFALWGIQSYFGGAGEVEVAEIEGTAITRAELESAFNRRLQQMDERPQGRAAAEMKKSVLEQMVREEVLIRTAQDAGMRIDDGYAGARIRSDSAFQTNGEFDQELYGRILSANRLTSDGYLAQQKRGLLYEQLLTAVASSGFVTKQELDEMVRLRDRRLELSYVTVPVAKHMAAQTVTDEQIAEYYEQNRVEFTVPEQVRLAYLKLDIKDLEKTFSVTEEQLRDLYEQQKDSFSVAEQREASHILVAVDEGAEAAAVEEARAKAEGIREQLAAGTKFDELARKQSDDPGSAELGGDLGAIQRGTIDPAFEEVVFSLGEGEVSQPVRTPFGFHIIKVTKVTPGTEKSYAEVKDELAAEARARRADELFYDYSERLFDLTYENPSNLEVAAQELGLTVQTTDWMSRQGTAEGIGADAEVLKAAFSEEVLAGGNPADGMNSKLIELKQDNPDQTNPVVVVRLQDYKPAELRPLAEVRDQIADRLRLAAAQKAARAVAGELLAEVQKGTPLKSVAETRELQVVEAGYVGRNDEKPDRALISAAFGLPKPSAERPVAGTVDLPSGDVAVLAVTGVQDGDPAKAPAQVGQFLEQMMLRLRGSAEVATFTDELRRQADVAIYEGKLDEGDEN